MNTTIDEYGGRTAQSIGIVSSLRLRAFSFSRAARSSKTRYSALAAIIMALLVLCGFWNRAMADAPVPPDNPPTYDRAPEINNALSWARACPLCHEGEILDGRCARCKVKFRVRRAEDGSIYLPRTQGDISATRSGIRRTTGEIQRSTRSINQSIQRMNMDINRLRYIPRRVR